MEKIIVIGGGGHAKVVIGLLKKIRNFQILGYTDVEDRGPILGIDYLGDDSKWESIQEQHPACLAAIGVGKIDVADKRMAIREKLKASGFVLPAIVSPDAMINEDVEIQEGTVVMDGAIINVSTKIGACAIINTASSVDHDCVIGDNVHVAPGVTVSGGVVIGHDSLISTGAKITQYKNICEHCLIGAGAVVVSDCNEPGVYLGTPAQRRTEREKA